MEFRLSKGHFLGLFCAVVWGATFISTKVLLEYLSPLQILFSRFLLGYIALWCLYPHRSPKYGRKAQLLFALAGFLGTFLYFLMENVALQHTTASNVGVLVSLAPLFTAAVSKLENPKLTLSLQFFVGAVLSFVGVLLIVFGDNMSLVINPLGDTLAVIWKLYKPVHCFSVRSSMRLNGEIRSQHAPHLKSCRKRYGLMISNRRNDHQVLLSPETEAFLYGSPYPLDGRVCLTQQPSQHVRGIRKANT